MSDERFRYYIETIQQQITALQGENRSAWEEINLALEGLQLIHEQMLTSLETAEILEEGLFEQTQQLSESYRYYHDLFQSLPIAYLITDANGLILEANAAIAHLLNVPQHYLVGKPLIVFVAQGDRPYFRTTLNQLSPNRPTQVLQTNLCPRSGKPLVVDLHINVVQSDSGIIKGLRIVAYNLSQPQPENAQVSVLSSELELGTSIQNSKSPTPSLPPLPQSLDGLQVLIVDDEVDVREFMTAVLESYGVGVRAVSSVAAALEELKRFHPDVLVSDIRMPGEDGYTLIRQIRALEAERGWHIPAAAITAYLDEDREKSLSAGFEAHLHKLAQPNELIEMVAQLAERAR